MGWRPDPWRYRGLAALIPIVYGFMISVNSMPVILAWLQRRSGGFWPAAIYF